MISGYQFMITIGLLVASCVTYATEGRVSGRLGEEEETEEEDESGHELDADGDSVRARVASDQFMITIGLLVASCVTYATEGRSDSGSYRIPIGIQFMPALVW
jgi:p-aminobenzoyl-glutamate transporter AbgT